MKTHIIRRPRLTRSWRLRAACLGYDPELWTLDDGSNNDLAQLKCVLDCPVREECLRRALHDEDPPTFGVVRGGIKFNSTQRVKCRRCGYHVASSRTRICWICRDYDPCLGQCGRMVAKVSVLNGQWMCDYCLGIKQERVSDVDSGTASQGNQQDDGWGGSKAG